MTRAQWIERYPDFPWLAPGDTHTAERLLRSMSLLGASEPVDRVDRAGEGNMNLTLRVTIGARTLILKQSRPWVEKYDHIAAPWDRANVEAGFYHRAATIDLVASRMPRLLGSDRGSCTIAIEDLGVARDFFGVYADAPLTRDTLITLSHWLRVLHDATRDRPDSALANRDMRALNHAHIFDIPLRDPPPLDLDNVSPGLALAASRLREHDPYRSRVAAAARRYLQDGPVLLHGDFFPGSWISTARGVFIIDPEFCFFGDPEFDLGVSIAHLALARRPISDAIAFVDAYGQAGVDPAQLASAAGIEVMRRLIGVAQLPLSPELDRPALLLRSRDAVASDDWRRLWPA